MHWGDRLKSKIEDRGWKIAELARRADLNYDIVTKYTKGEVSNPRGDTLERLADALGVTVAWLRDGEGPVSRRVPVVGYASGGDGWVPVDDFAQGGGLDEIDFELNDADPIAIAVRGHSMAPAYRDGDVLICSRWKGVDVSSAVGRDCVIRTVTGECYVKQLLRDFGENRFRLRSYNVGYTDIENVAIEWAAPVVWIHRKG